MSRQELADAVNAHLAGNDPGEANLDANHIGKFERGEHRWTNHKRREAFRQVLQVPTDKDIGFHIIRGLSSGPADTVEAWSSDLAPAAGGASAGPPGGVVDRRALLRTAALGIGAGLTPHDVIRQAAYDSTVLSGAAAGVLADGTLDGARADLRRLTTDYVITSDLPRIFGEALLLRDRLASLLDRPKVKPRDGRELHLMMGALCLLLASISHDAGEPHAGMTQATAAETFASVAEHDGLLGWVLCTKAMIDLWRHQPAAVLEHARRGATIASSASAAQRLHGLQLRALAQLDRKAEAIKILRQFDGASCADSPDPMTEYGSLFTFPESRQRYYAAVSFAYLGDCSAVERSVAALGHGEHPPATGTWPISWALSRSYLALARLDHRGTAGGPDAATDALAPVLTIPPVQRINQLDQVMSAVNSRLAQPAFRNNQSASTLRDAVREFRRCPRPMQAT